MNYDVSDLERFPISLEVMLCFVFFYSEYEFALSLGERSMEVEKRYCVRFFDWM